MYHTSVTAQPSEAVVHCRSRFHNLSIEEEFIFLQLVSPSHDLCNMSRLFILVLVVSFLLPVGFIHQDFHLWDVTRTATLFLYCMFIATLLSIFFPLVEDCGSPVAIPKSLKSD